MSTPAIDRREFVTAAASASLLLILPGAAFAGGPPPPPLPVVMNQIAGLVVSESSTLANFLAAYQRLQDRLNINFP